MADRFHISGAYCQSCNCPLPCPCGDWCPTSDCDVAVGCHIDQGFISGTDVSGLNVVGVYSIPRNLAEGRVRASLYLDQKANASQKKALEQIFTGQLGGQMGRLRPFIGQFDDQNRSDRIYQKRWP